jgi:hypothetical protein
MYIHVMFKFLSYLHTYVIGCVYTQSMLWVDISPASRQKSSLWIPSSV